MTARAMMTPEQRERARQRQKQYEASEKGRAKFARYRLTEGYRAAQERSMPRKIVTATAYQRRLREEHPEIIAARSAVGIARRRGDIQPPSSCPSCERVIRLDAHHHRGYAREHWLDIVWLCRRCHKAAHGKGVV